MSGLVISDKIFKRRVSSSVDQDEPSKLSNGVLAYSIPNDALYVSVDGRVLKVGGKQTAGVVTSNQAIIANSTGGIDTILIANAVIASLRLSIVYANNSPGAPGTVLHSNGVGTYWALAAVSAGDLTIDGGEF